MTLTTDRGLYISSLVNGLVTHFSHEKKNDVAINGQESAITNIYLFKLMYLDVFFFSMLLADLL